MRKTILFIFALFIISSAYAQTEDDYIEVTREVLKTEKKAAIADAMNLTESESVPFWELYNEYNFEVSKIKNKRIDIIKDYAKHFENLSDEKADELWSEAMNYDTQLLKLEKKYYKKFKKILPAGKAARYFQAENKIDALINAQFALEIPLIETK